MSPGSCLDHEGTTSPPFPLPFSTCLVLPRVPYVPLRRFAQPWMPDTGFCPCSLGLALNISNSHTAGDIALEKKVNLRCYLQQRSSRSLHPPLLGPLWLRSTPGVLSGLASSARVFFLLFKVSPRKQELVWSEMLSSKQPVPGGAEESLSKG